MKKLLLLIFIAASAFAQNPQRSSYVVQNAAGYLKTIPFAPVTLCEYNDQLQCNVPVTIFSDPALTQPIGYPFYANANGYFSYYAATGTYVEQQNGASFQISLGGGTGGGSGSVTSFSAGTGGPLFTTNVANPTSTPALTFTLTPQANNTFLANFSGSSAAPTYWTLAAGSNVTLTPSGSTLTISASSAGFPGAGIGNSTGTSWSSSYNAGNPIPVNFLPQATTSTFGVLKPDNITCTVIAGVFSCSGGISGQTINCALKAASVTTSTSSLPFCDDGTTSTLTHPLAINAPGASQIKLTYNSTPIVPAAGSGVFGVDSTGNGLLSENNAAAARICTATNAICGGLPGSPDKSVQTNQGGVFTGNANFTYNTSTGILALDGTPQVPLPGGYTVVGPLNIGPQESTLSQTMQDLINLNDNSVLVSKSDGATAGSNSFSVYSEFTNTSTIQRSQAISGTSFTTGTGTGTTTSSSVGVVGVGVSTPGAGNTVSEFVTGVLGSAQIGTFETSGTDDGTVPRLASVYAANNTNWGITANAVINAGFYAETQAGLGQLNAAFYAANQGTGSTDWAIYIAGGNNNLGPNQTTSGITIPYTIYSAAGTALPSCTSGLKGARTVVSDATGPTYLANYASGGAVVAPVMCNGTNWVTY